MFFSLLSLQAQNTEKGLVSYLDQNNQPTTKENATYYEFRTKFDSKTTKYQKYFISNGKAFLVEIYYYDQNNRKQGKYKSYFENGFIRKEGVYLHNLKSGEWKYYYKQADSLESKTSKSYLGKTVFFKSDKKDGPFKSYYFDGTLESEGNYKNNKLSGLCKWYYPNGNIASEENYDDNGKLISAKLWNEDGSVNKTDTKPNTSFRPLQKDIQKYVQSHFNKNLFRISNFGTGKIRVGVELSKTGELKIVAVQRVGFVPESFEKEVVKWIERYAEKEIEPIKYHNLPVDAVFKIVLSLKGKY